jgi:phosphatidylinositol glycan class A protein
MLERMCEKHTRSDLHHRVELLGTVAHCDVRDVLVRGHLFLNCSFTESFCMALLEAASCGLFVVSTDVGGIPEVLPPSMISLAKPNAEDVLRALEEAILIQATEQKASSFCSSSAGEKELQVIRQRHSTVCAMYSWPEVAKSAERVYDQVQANRRDDTLLARLRRYAIVLGPIWGLLACLLAVCMHLLWCLCDFVWPANKIERCIQFKEEEEDGEEEEEDQKSR